MAHRLLATLLILPLALARAFAQEAPARPSAVVSGFGTLAATRTKPTTFSSSGRMR